MNKIAGIFLFLLTTFSGHSQTPGNDMQMRQGGHVRFDFDGDGCATSAISAPVRLSLRQAGQQHFSYADPVTAVFGYLPGTYTVAPQPENAAYFNVSPSEASMVFGNSDNQIDFCITPNGYHPDAEVIIVPNDHAAVGNLISYHVIVRNKGNQTLNGAVHLNYPAESAAYVSASPAPHARTASAVNWNYTNLQPFRTRTFLINLQIGTPTQSSPVNLGDELDFSANVTTVEEDDTPEDNAFDLRQTAVSLLSPNSKICLEGAIAPPEMIGQYLDYVINFENNYTSTVHKIVINDEIDTNQFEMASLQVLNLSHPGIPVTLGNKLEVYFQDINLAPGEQGYVVFRIKTKPTIPVGSTVSNKAKIYFDFNFPIETNSVQTTFQLLNIGQAEVATAKIYPNPTNGLITIEANQDMTSVVLTDAQGRVIANLPVSSNLLTYDIAGLTSGVYCLKIRTANGTVTRKLLKQ
jgi:uncharacterized repeat protein (TIGR01451 family)